MTQNTFTTAIGSHLLRGTNPIFVKDYAMAIALFNLQCEEYKFTVPIKIHVASESTCTSCEG